MRAGFIEQPGTKNCAEQRIAILPCYRAMLSDAAVKCVSGSVCTVPETLHALYTMLLQENTPVLGKLFRPPWRLPESIRLCDNHTPDTRQLASGDHQEIETLLGQFRLDLSSSSFQDDSDTKGQVLQVPEQRRCGNESTATLSLSTRRGSTIASHIRVSCASRGEKHERKNRKAKYECGLPCALHGTAAPSRSLWHFARTTCLFVPKIAGSERQREARVWRFPRTIEAKVDMNPVVFEIPDI